jgi:hypothetical protein
VGLLRNDGDYYKRKEFVANPDRVTRAKGIIHAQGKLLLPVTLLMVVVVYILNYDF